MAARRAADASRMLKLSHVTRSLAALALVAAVASAAPLVRWCPLPWSAVSVEDFAACEARPSECARAQAAECGALAAGSACGTRACGSECGAPDRAAARSPEQPRAFCLEAPVAATQGPGSVALDPPAALAALVPVAAELPVPACVAARPIAFEPARPRARPPGLPPPVRGPPCVA